MESCTPSSPPIFLPPLSRFLSYPVGWIEYRVATLKMKSRGKKREKKEKRKKYEHDSHRWFRMNLSERHVSLPFRSLSWKSKNARHSNLDIFHGRDGRNIVAAEISCGSRPISTTTIIESGVYRRKSSIPSSRLYHPLYLSYFDRESFIDLLPAISLPLKIK